MNLSISRCKLASGKRPRAAATLSSAWCGLVVPGIGMAPVGWDITYFRNTCAQELASISPAQSGSARSPTASNNLPRPKGRLTSTATPLSRAIGSIVSAILRLPRDLIFGLRSRRPRGATRYLLSVKETVFAPALSSQPNRLRCRSFPNTATHRHFLSGLDLNSAWKQQPL